VTTKTHRTVVRNQPYKRESIGIRERHNERKNTSYSNPDVVPAMSHLNVHFRQCEITYNQILDQMLESGAVSNRGLKPDAKVFGELVFDVNTAYFAERGGYDYAKRFFQEAFHFAEKELGANYILSAVMHADERNRSLSEELGRDVYHYHLHVVYIPVVNKEVKWSKRCKDKSLVGTTKEVIHQISHSKKWTFVPVLDEHGQPVLRKDGKPKLIPSYSLLQDKFFEHMSAAGFKDFERGERGSTAEHLTVLDYKIQQDKAWLEQIENQAAEQSKKLESISKELASSQQVRKTHAELDGMGRKKLFGKIELSEQNFKEVISLAKEGVSSRGKIHSLEHDLHGVTVRLWDLDEKLTRLVMSTRNYKDAMQLAPERVEEVLSDIFQKAEEEKTQRRLLQRSRQSRGISR
jgi:archaellum component FlaC